MASAIAAAAQAAHSVASSVLSIAQITSGATLPEPSASSILKENAADESVQLDVSGKVIIIGVPGAFTGTCSRQIPGYIKKYDELMAKGIKNIYVISVNDVFVMQAWKDNLAPEGTKIRFIADDKGAYTGALGMLFDATSRLGGPRSKRYVIVAEDGKVKSIAVEEIPSNLTVTDADAILAAL